MAPNSGCREGLGELSRGLLPKSWKLWSEETSNYSVGADHRESVDMSRTSPSPNPNPMASYLCDLGQVLPPL